MELKSSRHESVSAVSTLVWNWPLNTSRDAEGPERVLYPWERKRYRMYHHNYSPNHHLLVSVYKSWVN